jgi:hypothetical protein
MSHDSAKKIKKALDKIQGSTSNNKNIKDYK